MSVLLDALKKAAAEKKAKQAEHQRAEGDQAALDTDLVEIERPFMARKSGSNPKISELEDLGSKSASANFHANNQKKPSITEIQALAEVETSATNSETDVHSVSAATQKKPVIESKFKLADADLDSTPNYSSSSSKLMDVLGEIPDSSNVPQDTTKKIVESSESKSQTIHTNSSATTLNHSSSLKQAELEALFKPGNKISVKQQALQSKKVKKLFSPALTTTMKPIKSSMTRKLYFILLGLGTFVVVLIYYALFIYQDLEYQYEHQVQELTSAIERPTQPLQAPLETKVVQTQTEADSVKPADEPQSEPAKKEPTGQTNIVEAKNTASSNSVNEEPTAQSTTRPGSSVQIKRVDKVDENQLAYEAYLKSDFQKAEYHYRRGLAQNPNSKNSQIGLAALASQQRDYEQAMSYYHRVLQQNPEDEDALLGIASIAAELSSQDAMLSDLVSLARRYPESATLQFALGNQYAQRQDWFKAQQHYFDSVRLEQNNPDYRLNLAVSLDHLGQFRDALEHYKHSMALAEDESTAQFDAGMVYQRIHVLQSFLEQN